MEDHGEVIKDSCALYHHGGFGVVLCNFGGGMFTWLVDDNDRLHECGCNWMTDEILETFIFMGKDGKTHNLEIVESGDGEIGVRFEGKVRYFKKDALGLQFMKDTYTAKYLKGKTEITSFLSKKDSTESALETIGRYTEYAELYGEGSKRLIQNGIEFFLCDMGGSFDIIFQKGQLIGGVLSVADQATATQSVFELWKQIKNQ